MFSINDKLVKEETKIESRKGKDERVNNIGEFKVDATRKIVAYCHPTKQVLFLQTSKDDSDDPFSTLMIHHPSFIDPVVLCDFPSIIE